jgi:hypothetical protein
MPDPSSNHHKQRSGWPGKRGRAHIVDCHAFCSCCIFGALRGLAIRDTLKERIKTPPDDGGHWTGPKIARWLAKFHGVQAAHDQRGWDALIAIEARMSLRRSMLAGRGGREAESSTVRVDNHSSSLYGMPVIPAKPWPQV